MKKPVLHKIKWTKVFFFCFLSLWSIFANETLGYKASGLKINENQLYAKIISGWPVKKYVWLLEILWPSTKNKPKILSQKDYNRMLCCYSKRREDILHLTAKMDQHTKFTNELSNWKMVTKMIVVAMAVLVARTRQWGATFKIAIKLHSSGKFLQLIMQIPPLSIRVKLMNTRTEHCGIMRKRKHFLCNGLAKKAKKRLTNIRQGALLSLRKLCRIYLSYFLRHIF